MSLNATFLETGVTLDSSNAKANTLEQPEVGDSESSSVLTRPFMQTQFRFAGKRDDAGSYPTGGAQVRLLDSGGNLIKDALLVGTAKQFRDSFNAPGAIKICAYTLGINLVLSATEGFISEIDNLRQHTINWGVSEVNFGAFTVEASFGGNNQSLSLVLESNISDVGTVLWTQQSISPGERAHMDASIIGAITGP